MNFQVFDQLYFNQIKSILNEVSDMLFFKISGETLSLYVVDIFQKCHIYVNFPISTHIEETIIYEAIPSNKDITLYQGTFFADDTTLTYEFKRDQVTLGQRTAYRLTPPCNYYNAYISLSYMLMVRVFVAMMTFGDTICISVDPHNAVCTMVSKNEIARSSIDIHESSYASIRCEEPITQKYASKYLKFMVSINELENITLSVNTDMLYIQGVYDKSITIHLAISTT